MCKNNCVGADHKIWSILGVFTLENQLLRCGKEKCGLVETYDESPVHFNGFMRRSGDGVLVDILKRRGSEVFGK
jgi:hypothetical protein